MRSSPCPPQCRAFSVGTPSRDLCADGTSGVELSNPCVPISLGTFRRRAHSSPCAVGPAVIRDAVTGYNAPSRHGAAGSVTFGRGIARLPAQAHQRKTAVVARTGGALGTRDLEPD